MVGLTVGGLRKTGRKSSKKKRITSKATNAYYRQNQLKPVVSTISRLYAPHLPAQVSYTLRLSYSQLIVVPVANAGAGFNQNMVLPRSNEPGIANQTWAGGLLALMRIYDKAQTLKTKSTVRISSRPVLTGNPSVPQPYWGAAQIAFGVLSQEAANALPTDSPGLARLRDVPFSQYRHLGAYNSGHDVVSLTVAADIEKFIGQPQDTLQSVRRVNNVILSQDIDAAIMSTTPNAVFIIVPELAPAERAPFTTHTYFVEHEFDMTIMFTSMRQQARTLADINVLLDAGEG